MAWSIYPRNGLNDFAYYVKTNSNSMATKIWGISIDWELKSIAFGLTLQHLTGSKEAVKIAHKCGNIISYSDIRLLNSAWSQLVTKSCKTKAYSYSIDNSDGQQQTSTGLNTTHFTNGIISQNSVEQGPIIPQVSLTKDKNIFCF